MRVFVTDNLYVSPEIRIGWELHIRTSFALGLQFGRQRLDRRLHGDIPIELRIPRPIHLSHAALTERFEDFVMTQALADHDDGSVRKGSAPSTYAGEATEINGKRSRAHASPASRRRHPLLQLLELVEDDVEMGRAGSFGLFHHDKAILDRRHVVVARIGKEGGHVRCEQRDRRRHRDP